MCFSRSLEQYVTLISSHVKYIFSFQTDSNITELLQRQTFESCYEDRSQRTCSLEVMFDNFTYLVSVLM
jgi:hypothetical protein